MTDQEFYREKNLRKKEQKQSMNQTIESQRYQEPNEEEEGQFGIFDEEVSLN